MGLWDFFQGFGESLEDWGGGRDYGMGSINPAAGFMDSFKGLDQVGYPGPINRAASSYTPWHQQLDYGGPQQNEAEQLYQYYLRSAQDRTAGMGDFFRSPQQWSYLDALGRASGDREGFHTARTNFSIPLRNAQHGLVGQVAAGESPLGRISGLFSVPTYNLAKLFAQSGIPGAGPAMDFLGDRFLDSGPNSLTEASPPSWESIWWGLRPWWGKN